MELEKAVESNYQASLFNQNSGTLQENLKQAFTCLENNMIDRANMFYQKAFESIDDKLEKKQALQEEFVYQLSMHLLLTKNLTQFNTVLQWMSSMLEKEIHPTKKAWLMGRVVAAATRLEDKETTKDYVKKILNILEKEHKPDAFSVWALGYLAGYDLNQYKELLMKSLNCLALNQQKSDLVWAYVVALIAAANHQDFSFYKEMLEKINELDLNSIPKTDFRLWAISLVQLAAVMMSDQGTYEYSEKNFQENEKKADGFNLKLANSNYEAAQKILEQTKSHSI